MGPLHRKEDNHAGRSVYNNNQANIVYIAAGSGVYIISAEVMYTFPPRAKRIHYYSAGGIK